MRRALVTALAREGVPMEVAARVLLAVLGGAAPIDLGRFAPEASGGYVIGAERFRDTLAELHGLHLAHWQETEKYRHGLAMAPDYEALTEREEQGRLLQITCRSDGVLVGHVRMFINQSLHTCTLYGDEDTLYLTPAHRGSFVAIRMMRYAQRWLLALGIREIRCNSKLSNNAAVLMRRLGYPAVATQFCKLFTDEEAARIVQKQGELRPGDGATHMEGATT